MESRTESGIRQTDNEEPGVSTPMSRAQKRAAIQKSVDERRRQIAEEKRQLIPVNSLLTPSAAAPLPDAQKDHRDCFSLFSTDLTENSSALNVTLDSNCDALCEVFPTPKLSPSQQRALDRHQLRQLRARLSQNLKKEAQEPTSLRELSAQLQQQQKKLEEHGDEDVRKSPLSQDFDAIIRCVTANTSAACIARGLSRDSALDKSTHSSFTDPFSSPFSHSRFRTPTSIHGSKSSTRPSSAKRSSSRQLDFDSQCISFDASPLKVFGPLADIGDLLNSVPCKSMMLTQHVSVCVVSTS
jgi:hypothetical protein